MSSKVHGGFGLVIADERTCSTSGCSTESMGRRTFDECYSAGATWRARDGLAGDCSLLIALIVRRG